MSALLNDQETGLFLCIFADDEVEIVDGAHRISGTVFDAGSASGDLDGEDGRELEELDVVQLSLRLARTAGFYAIIATADAGTARPGDRIRLHLRARGARGTAIELDAPHRGVSADAVLLSILRLPADHTWLIVHAG